MEKQIRNLLSVLQQDGLKPDTKKLEGIKLTDGYGTILGAILPDHFFCYDTEIIDDITGYRHVIGIHSENSSSQWLPQEVQITGSVEKSISISFKHNGKNVKWTFDQHGSDYVSEDFYKRMDSWVSRNLPGRFVMLPTGFQDICFAYLPKASAAKLKQLMKKFFGIDDFVDFFRNSKDYAPEEFYRLRDNPDFDHCAKDSSGETALTAALKNKNILQVKTVIDFEFANIQDKNSHGESPLQLARDLHREIPMPEIVTELEERVSYTSSSWSELAWSRGLVEEELVDLMDKIEAHKQLETTWQCVPVLSGIWFGHSESIELGNDTLSVWTLHPVHRTEKEKAFRVTYYSPVGTTDDYLKKNLTISEALECVERFYGIKMS